MSDSNTSLRAQDMNGYAAASGGASDAKVRMVKKGLYQGVLVRGSIAHKF